MKLYYSGGSCSTSCHITLEESGLKYETIEVDFDNEADPNIALTRKLNPLGTLPIFVTDDGKQLDQNLAIHIYVADKGTNKTLFPAPGTFERIEALNMLSFVAADLHKAIGGLFVVPSYTDKNVQTAVRKNLLERVATCLAYTEAKLEGKDFLLGKTFTVVDAYAFVVIGWTKWVEVPLTNYKNIQNYMTRVAARPAVAKVLKEEGLA